MVIPARSSSKAYLRGSGKSFSTQTLIAIFFGSSLLALSFLAGVFYNESTHYDAPLKSNLRGAATLNIPVPVVSDTLIDPNQDSTQEFFPDTTKHNQKKWGKIKTRPDDWVMWSFHDVHSEFKCSEHAHDQNKPLPDLAFWNFYRDTFKRVVDNDIEFDSVPPTEGYTMNGDGKQPYYAKISPGKGRGLFASRDIKKGGVVHDGNASDIEMSANDWRSMAFALPQKMACDFSEWTWTQQTEKGGPYKIFTAFNISILMNSSKAPNTMPKSSYSSKMYALRDIKKDEEILTDYKIYPTKWERWACLELEILCGVMDV